MYKLDNAMAAGNDVNVSLPRELFQEADKMAKKNKYHVKKATWKTNYGVKLIVTFSKGDGNLIGDGSQFLTDASPKRGESFLWKVSGGGHGYASEMICY